MATMCFEKAGDAYREKWARAAGLLATADRVISTNLEMGQASLQKASEIYESIGMHEKAATCYIKLGEYKRAGVITLHNFIIHQNDQGLNYITAHYIKCELFLQIFISLLFVEEPSGMRLCASNSAELGTTLPSFQTI